MRVPGRRPPARHSSVTTRSRPVTSRWTTTTSTSPCSDSIRRSTAASTGTRASTCSGPSSVCCPWPPRRWTRAPSRSSIGGSPPGRSPSRWTTCVPARRTSGPMAGPGCVRLASAVQDCPLPEARPWSEALAPLVEHVARLTSPWMRRQVLPSRHGLQGNSAFALLMFLDSFERLGRLELAEEVRARAVGWFGADTNYDTRFEPSGTDVFSPGAERGRPDAAGPALGLVPDLGRPIPAGPRRRPAPPPPGRPPAGHRGGRSPHPPVGPGPVARLAAALARPARGRPGARWPNDCSTAPPRRCRPFCRDSSASDFMSTHWLVSFGLLAQTPVSMSGRGSRSAPGALLWLLSSGGPRAPGAPPEWVRQDRVAAAR